ncbi:hypothetical protein BYT27DRAFT_7192995 [Phlegmacium glaucopus]|nr:hypothetical protein BYT27DRAFT_7192995 [Phlegmacium glaucopus]
MGKFFTEIPSTLVPWIQEQRMFWVATAPLSSSGHINLSPKGYEGTFHIVNENRIWYEDLTGSGIETIAHLKENGRMTIMFTGFNGAPRIVRLFGIGTVHEFGSPEYEALIPMENRHVGSRAAIVLDIHKVGSSCGYAVPLYDFKKHRTGLNHYSVKLETEDIRAQAESCAISAPPSPSSNTSVVRTSFETETDHPSEVQTYPLTDKGLKGYWRDKNHMSIDGLPGVTSGFKAPQPFFPNANKARAEVQPRYVERVEPASSVQVRSLKGWEQEKHGIVVGFILGVLAMVVVQRGISGLAGIQWS